MSEEFGRKKNQDVNGNRNFWKEVSKVNGGKVELEWNKRYKLEVDTERE